MSVLVDYGGTLPVKIRARHVIYVLVFGLILLFIAKVAMGILEG